LLFGCKVFQIHTYSTIEAKIIAIISFIARATGKCDEYIKVDQLLLGDINI
jgi:hypothetical protein